MVCEVIEIIEGQTTDAEFESFIKIETDFDWEKFSQEELWNFVEEFYQILYTPDWC